MTSELKENTRWSKGMTSERKEKEEIKMVTESEEMSQFLRHVRTDQCVHHCFCIS